MGAGQPNSGGSGEPGPVRLLGDGVAALMAVLRAAGREVIGPTVRDGAIVLRPLKRPDDLPRGWHDRQEAGLYRLDWEDRPTRFAHAAPAQGWKRVLHPPEACVGTAYRGGIASSAEGADAGPDGPCWAAPEASPPLRAFFGVRPCDLAALSVLDGILANPAAGYHDPAYARRRRDTLVVAADCASPAATCFCAGMGTGPGVGDSGFDVALTELVEGDAAVYLARAGSPAGAALLEAVEHRPASDAERAAATDQTVRATKAQTRALPADPRAILARATEHRHWADVAARCLACGTCTLACPTCFCATVEDATSLDGVTAARTRRWSSCFTEAFSYIHGGAVRGTRGARYRQWITHKLSAWYDQFGTSGCVGCGRCVTWCPVGIDITAEVAALSETRPSHRRRGPARRPVDGSATPRRRKDDPPAP
ncbi:hypothetical protein F1188_09915 [Roseospira marina]|uniref:4Fe-4S ferredoxin-type domain-containing protein n=1 Tax=Roseospira marina TaxID=140057 RepID=A0A5M6ICQ8_9PROT|nr:4Fe-4S dicluster domain-containing protein [Roseospira marina]KAA5605549.1 hypothetical protein F1188_09915 [Roseospira marina]MBB4313390.1 ferredoxin [Roseospira marina]MBB5085869.1 ferredoxin [Roseospira marina]